MLRLVFRLALYFTCLAFAATCGVGARRAGALTDEELLDQTEARAALYFWEQTINPSGFVRDNSDVAFSSIAAAGLGLAALAVIADRAGSTPEWTVTAAQAEARALSTLEMAVSIQENQASDPSAYGKAGLLFHFVDADGRRALASEVSTVDNAILQAGALTAGEYFGGQVRDKAEELFANADWSYFFDPSPPKPEFTGFHFFWKPAAENHCTVVPPDGDGCLSDQQWDRPTDEILLIALIALAGNLDHAGFRAALYRFPRIGRSYAGVTVVNSFFGSLFTYFFAQIFIDFRALGADDPPSVGSSAPAVNWYANACNAALANRQFAIAQSELDPDQFATYGPDQWGASPCYTPEGPYVAQHGAKPVDDLFNGGQPNDAGVVPPYGAISTLPLVRTSDSQQLDENLAFRALRKYFDDHALAGLWGPYGPRDSFRTQLQAGEPVTSYAAVYVGIDVGPEALMIENYRSGLIHSTFMGHPGVLSALQLHFPEFASGPGTLDEIGPGCQCGDVNDDSRLLIDDVVRIRRAMAGLAPALRSPAKCNVTGPVDASDGDANGLRDDCGTTDIVRIRNALAGIGPGVDQACEPLLVLPAP